MIHMTRESHTVRLIMMFCRAPFRLQNLRITMMLVEMPSLRHESHGDQTNFLHHELRQLDPVASVVLQFRWLLLLGLLQPIASPRELWRYRLQGLAAQQHPEGILRREVGVDLVESLVRAAEDHLVSRCVVPGEVGHQELGMDVEAVMLALAVEVVRWALAVAVGMR